MSAADRVYLTSLLGASAHMPELCPYTPLGSKSPTPRPSVPTLPQNCLSLEPCLKTLISLFLSHLLSYLILTLSEMLALLSIIYVAAKATYIRLLFGQKGGFSAIGVGPI